MLHLKNNEKRRNLYITIRGLYATKKYHILMDGETQEDIDISFGISLSHVSQIIYRNRHLLSADQNYEKVKKNIEKHCNFNPKKLVKVSI